MTIRQRVLRSLTERGLFPDEAEAIFNTVQANADIQAMRDRWEDREDDYPPVLLAGLILLANTAAVAWIDSNKPQHWARSLFV